MFSDQHAACIGLLLLYSVYLSVALRRSLCVVSFEKAVPRAAWSNGRNIDDFQPESGLVSIQDVQLVVVVSVRCGEGWVKPVQIRHREVKAMQAHRPQATSAK
jgi:hypothetical protein